MFEPIHESAADTGKGIANPLGALWSAAEMVAWIGERDASVKLMQAVESTVGRGIKTADLGGSHSTVVVVEAFCFEIEMLYEK
ncbi:Isocitrate/Isopropylmalate dehydrogenase-like protein [Viridothelium virens]|uniref:Isocitrate/Isopropylmalate dehydrogenase-like protein n=1 Tax=Viridothelium virens TaxID=1048519 RepID=A0A6A6HC37_VIRVR|nr:Isocitrate/Isopropylmalate dehydrogenase-like protein [Viridothelium virens]